MVMAMIKARIADFPGMRPGNHNIDAIVVTDFRGNRRQTILSDDVDIEVSFEVRRRNKLMMILEGRRRFPSLIGYPVLTGHDVKMMLAGMVIAFLGLVLLASHL